MPDPYLITIIIVTYNSAEYLRRLAATLCAVDANQCKIIWVDNCSTPDQVIEYEAIKLESLADLELLEIRNNENIGFGAAVNAALTCVNTRYVLLLNPDVTLNSMWGSTMLAYASAGELDIVGSPSFDAQGAGDRNIRRVPGILHNILGDLLCDIDSVYKNSAYIDFSCLLMRTSIFQQYGPLADYFLYGEDAEYWCRISNSKWNIKYDKTIFYIHQRSHSSVGENSHKHLRILYSDMHSFSANNGLFRRIGFITTLLAGTSMRFMLRPRTVVPRIRLVFALRNAAKFLSGELYIQDFHVRS